MICIVEDFLFTESKDLRDLRHLSTHARTKKQTYPLASESPHVVLKSPCDLFLNSVMSKNSVGAIDFLSLSLSPWSTQTLLHSFAWVGRYKLFSNDVKT